MNITMWCFYALLYRWRTNRVEHQVQFTLAAPECFPVADCVAEYLDEQKITVQVAFAPALVALPKLAQAWLWQVYRCHEVTHYLWHIASKPLDTTTTWLCTLSGYVLQDTLTLQQRMALFPWLHSAQIGEQQLEAVLCALLPIESVACFPLAPFMTTMAVNQQTCLANQHHALGNSAWLGQRLPLAKPRCQITLGVKDRYHFLPGCHWRKTLDALLAWLVPECQIDMAWSAPSCTNVLRMDRPLYLGWTVSL